MKHRLGAHHLTAAGGALLFVLGAAVIVLLLGPRHDERPAFIVIAIVLTMIVLKLMPTGGFGRESGLSERREQLPPAQRQAPGAADRREEEEAWQREREAYADASVTQTDGGAQAAPAVQAAPSNAPGGRPSG